MHSSTPQGTLLCAQCLLEVLSILLVLCGGDHSWLKWLLELTKCARCSGTVLPELTADRWWWQCWHG